jgi:hypothetical protein
MAAEEGVRRQSLFFLACVLVVAGAAAVRLAGIYTDFWLDEIWSWMFVRDVSSPLALFTEIRHDNNHWLNSLFLYFLGTQQHWYVYRLLSLVTGTGSVILAGMIGRRDGRWESFLALVLVGFSYLLVYFASEARGYAPLAFFALMCFYLMQQQMTSLTTARAVLFSISAVLGILSHLTFVFVYAALVLWSVVVFVHRRRSWPKVIALLLAHHALPLAVLVLLYYTNIRGMRIGGGPVRPLPAVFQEIAVVSLGSPDLGWAAFVIASFTVVAVLVELWRSRDRYDAEWIFFAAVLVLPLVPVIAQVRQDFYTRYFLTSILFLLILLSRFLARCFRGKIWIKCAAGVLVLVFLVGNGVQMASFFHYGRGHLSEVVAYMAEHTPGEVITVGSNHNGGTPMVLYFYVLNFAPAKAVQFLPPDRWSRDAPRWYIFHSQANDANPPRDIVLPNRLGYSLQGSFQGSSPDEHWFLYGAKALR